MLARSRGSFVHQMQRRVWACRPRLVRPALLSLSKMPLISLSTAAHKEKARVAVASRHEKQDATIPQAEADRLKNIRNIGIVAHVDAGKTTTTERLLYYTRSIRTMGDVDEGNTTMDFLEQERERGITIQAAAISFQWRDHYFNLIDTPGHIDFTLEVERSMRVLDGVVTLIDAVKGVQAQSDTVWRQAEKYRVPRIVYVNKMDRAGASFNSAVNSVRHRLGATVLPLQLPVFTVKKQGQTSTTYSVSEDEDVAGFVGVVDLVRMKMLTWDSASPGNSQQTTAEQQGEVWQEHDMTKYPDIQKQAQIAREKLIETAADLDDQLLELYTATSSDAIPPEALRAGIRRITVKGKGFPALMGSSLRNKAVQPLLDAVVDYLPAPFDRALVAGSLVGSSSTANASKIITRRSTANEPLSALAFKIVHDPFRGSLVYVRVFTGTLRARQSVINIPAADHVDLEIDRLDFNLPSDDYQSVEPNNAQQSQGSKQSKHSRERIAKLVRVMGARTEEVEELKAGEIGAVLGLKETRTGNTLVAANDEPKLWLRLRGIRSPDPVFFCSVEAPSQSFEKALEQALEVITRDDPSVRVEIEPSTGQRVIKGMGELHLEILKHRLHTEFSVNAEFGDMEIAYREGVSGETQQQATYDGLIEGAQTFAAVTLQLSPIESNPDDKQSPLSSLLENQITLTEAVPLPLPAVSGGPQQSIKPTVTHAEVLESAYQGMQEALGRGPVKGYPMVRARVKLINYQLSANSTALAVRAAAARCVREALKKLHNQGSVSVLEPIMRAEITMDAQYVGDVLTELTSRRRAEVKHVNSGDKNGKVNADKQGWSDIVVLVPLVEVVGYSTALRSRTHGTGSFSMQLVDYHPTR